MVLTIISRQYPNGIIERIVEKQFRLGGSDEELYDNANAVTRNAIDEAERITSRFICRTRAQIGLAGLLPRMVLAIAPVREVVSVKYYNDNDELVTLAADNYIAEPNANELIISLIAPMPKLTSRPRTSKVIIEVDGGYDDYALTADPSNINLPTLRVPGMIESAIQMIAANRFNLDGDTSEGRSISQAPTTAATLLEHYRILPYGGNL